MDLVFIIDASGGIGIDNFELIKKIIVNLTRHFPISATHARVGIIKYSTTPEQVLSLRRSERIGFTGLQRKITRMRYTKGTTSTGEALRMAYRMLTVPRGKIFGQKLKDVKGEKVLILLLTG